MNQSAEKFNRSRSVTTDNDVNNPFQTFSLAYFALVYIDDSDQAQNRIARLGPTKSINYVLSVMSRRGDCSDGDGGEG